MLNNEIASSMHSRPSFRFWVENCRREGKRRWAGAYVCVFVCVYTCVGECVCSLSASSMNQQIYIYTFTMYRAREAESSKPTCVALDTKRNRETAISQETAINSSYTNWHRSIRLHTTTATGDGQRQQLPSNVFITLSSTHTLSLRSTASGVVTVRLRDKDVPSLPITLFRNIEKHSLK